MSHGVLAVFHDNEGAVKRRRQYSRAVSRGTIFWPGKRAMRKVCLYTRLKKSGVIARERRKDAIWPCCLGRVSALCSEGHGQSLRDLGAFGALCEAHTDGFAIH